MGHILCFAILNNQVVTYAYSSRLGLILLPQNSSSLFCYLHMPYSAICAQYMFESPCEIECNLWPKDVLLYSQGQEMLLDQQ